MLPSPEFVFERGAQFNSWEKRNGVPSWNCLAEILPIKKAGEQGIEPRFRGPEPRALPLDHSPGFYSPDRIYIGIDSIKFHPIYTAEKDCQGDKIILKENLLMAETKRAQE